MWPDASACVYSNPTSISHAYLQRLIDTLMDFTWLVSILECFCRWAVVLLVPFGSDWNFCRAALLNLPKLSQEIRCPQHPKWESPDLVKKIPIL